MNTFAFAQPNFVPARLFALLTVLSLLGSLIPMQVFATQIPEVPTLNPNVDICHATQSPSNPYSNGAQNVDANSIVSGGNAHDGHNDGGLDNKGDIIPSFQYGDPENPTTYPGKNWNFVFSNGMTGEQIAQANCDIPTQGTIVVNKVTVPAEDEQQFAFTTTGTGYNGFSLADTTSPNSQTLVAGSYTVAETAVAGWTQTSAVCVSSDQDTETIGNLNLDVNETITCTFTNTKDVEEILGCTDPAALNYNDAATSGNTDAEDCVYDDGREVLTACKYNATEESIEGWGMTITNDREGEANVTFSELSTEEDGCVSVLVYPEDGPFYITEENRSGWTQQSVHASNGQVIESEGADYCEFFSQEVIFKDQILDFISEEIINIENSCSFYNLQLKPVDVCKNIEGDQAVVPKGYQVNDSGICTPVTINTCLVPNTLEDNSPFVLGNSGEKTVAQMLAEHGYAAVDTTNDQINYQVWNLTDPTADTITFNLKVLGKRAGNTQILGYYKAGDGTTFAAVLTQVSDTNGEVSVPVTIPAAFANSFGFGIISDDKTWYSEKSLNSDAKDHVAVYNPVANTYLLAFEDFNNLGDADYNDLVVEIADVTCVPPPPPIDMCQNLEGLQESIPEGMIKNQAGDCVPANDDEIINTCLVPSTLEDASPFVLGNSGEKTVAQMLAEHGYAAVDTTNDQINYQVWNLVDPNADVISFNVKVLGKRAGNTQILGYYKAGDGTTFSSVLTQVSDTDGDVVIPVTIPAAFANSFGFGIISDGLTWYSEKSLNSDSKDHVAVYNPAANTYLLAFEDFNNLGDGDYNDLVVEIAGVSCAEEVIDNNPTDQSSSSRGGSGSRSQRSGTPQVLGDATSTPLVLGEQVSVVPFGAPGTGQGGTSNDLLPKLFAAVATARRKVIKD